MRRAPRPWPVRETMLWGLLLIAVLCVGRFAFDALRNHGMLPSFGFLGDPSGFDLSESLIPYSGESIYAKALLAGGLNTLKVAAVAIAISSLLGMFVALCRLASNPILSACAAAYVECTRNIPLLLQLFAWYALITLGLPGPRQALEPLPGVLVSNRGLRLPSLDASGHGIALAVAALVAALLAVRLAMWWQNRPPPGRVPLALHRSLMVRFVFVLCIAALAMRICSLALGADLSMQFPVVKGFGFAGGLDVSPEFTALAAGLSVYTSGSLAEVIRGAIASVPKAQTEAAIAVGLGPLARYRLVILPQAVNFAIPPATNQYLNVLKNSSLAVAIGYPDLVSVGNTAINQTGQAIAVIFIFMLTYLVLGFLISFAMHRLHLRATPHVH